MKKILAVMLAVLMLASVMCFASCKKEDTLTVYTEAGFAPYEFVYEGEIVGELDPKTTTVQELGLYMAGAKRQDGKEATE